MFTRPTGPGASGGRGGGSAGRGRPYERRPDIKVRADDDGRTEHLVDKLFSETRAGIVGKQTAGSQTMFQV